MYPNVHHLPPLADRAGQDGRRPALLAVIRECMVKPPPVLDIDLYPPNGWWFPASRPGLAGRRCQLVGPPPWPCSASMSARSAAMSTLAAAVSSWVMITQASSRQAFVQSSVDSWTAPQVTQPSSWLPSAFTFTMQCPSLGSACSPLARVHGCPSPKS